jgi:N-acetylmuramoyl-L-alanine amidase
MRIKSLILILGIFFWGNGLYASPLHVLRIAIDVGHDKLYGGAVSARGIPEYVYNLKMAKELLEILKKESQVDAFIINAEGKHISLKHRVYIAKEKRADILISIHHDSVQKKYLHQWKYKGYVWNYSDDFSGYSIFVSRKNSYFKSSLWLARALGKQLHKKGFTFTRHHTQKIKGENKKLLDQKYGIYAFDNLVVLKASRIPAVLLECGILVNRKEELILDSEMFRTEVADAIRNTVLQWVDQYQK